MKLYKIIILLILALGCRCELSAQTDADKKAQAIEILTSEDYYSICLEGEWDSPSFDTEKLTKKARKQLVENIINPERKKKGLRTSFSIDRWIPVLNTLIYRDRDFGHLVVYISEKDMLAFGTEAPGASDSAAAAMAAASSSASSTSTSAAPRRFNLPAGVNLDVPKGVEEAITELSNHPAMTAAEADDMVYALFEDKLVTDFRQFKDVSELMPKRMLYEINDDKVGRIAGYCSDGEFHDLRTGSVISKGEFDTSKWIIVEYEP